MAPKVNIKRFSRSKVEETVVDTPIIKKSKSKKEVRIIEPEPEPEPEQIYSEPEIEEEPEYYPDYNPNEEDNDFLTELNNSNYKEEVKQDKPKKEQLTDSEKLIQQFASGKIPKQKKIKEIRSSFEDDDNLFDDIGTECLGRDKREMIAKINQYKNLFPDELKKFKCKKGASTEELKVYLEEMECIVDTSSIENFLNDSILQCIQLVEGVSSYSSKYNIQGCADLLKGNKQFHSLCKQLYIKYKVFSAIPIEFQMLMMVATTAYICKSKNQNKIVLDSYLNEPLKQTN